MGGLHGADVLVLRHALQKDEKQAARDLAGQVSRGLFAGGRRSLAVTGPALAAAVGELLNLLGRCETGALFVLDGSEHLTTKQIAALRRRSGHPIRDPKLAVGALEDPRPATGRKVDGSVHETPPRRNMRFRISSVARHLTTAGRGLLTARNKAKVDRAPILAPLALPAAERDEANRLGQALLEARFAGTPDTPVGAMPRAILFALLDLVTILVRGSRAYVLVLDHDHLDDVGDPRALDAYTVPALLLEKISARTIYRQRVKAQKAARMRVLEDPIAVKARVMEAGKMATRGGPKDRL